MRFNTITTIFISLFFTTISKSQPGFYQRLADSAATLTKQKVVYDLSYYSIAYPKGDVPPDKGVCTDVIIRTYRKLQIDLQQLVHEDMVRNFSAYPTYWGLRSTDKNIDHRRVPNLITFFKRKGAAVPITNNPVDYQPGDIVCWLLPRGMKHIGLLVKQRSLDHKRYLIMHNIGNGQVIEDCLFSYQIIGHFRYMR